MSTVAQIPTLPPAPAKLKWGDRLLVTVEVVTATAKAALIRLPGGDRTTWIPFSVALERPAGRDTPEGCRVYSVTRWLHDRIAAELNPPD